MNDFDSLTFRHEEKFIITPFEAEIIKNELSIMCFIDPHADNEGEYNIKSIYFDTNNDKFLHETIDGVNNRHKYRIRAYNNDLSRISLEKKFAENGLKRKESDLISLDICKELTYEGVLAANATGYKTLSSMQTESLIHPIVPKVIIGYKRIPFVYPMGNVRITIDSEIVASNDLESFFFKDYTSYCEVLPGMIVLEIKYDEFLPGQIRDILSRNGILFQSSFSKYAMGRIKIDEGAYV